MPGVRYPLLPLTSAALMADGPLYGGSRNDAVVAAVDEGYRDPYGSTAESLRGRRASTMPSSSTAWRKAPRPAASAARSVSV